MSDELFKKRSREEAEAYQKYIETSFFKPMRRRKRRECILRWLAHNWLALIAVILSLISTVVSIIALNEG